jgi:hypothetical protein
MKSILLFWLMAVVTNSFATNNKIFVSTISDNGVHEVDLDNCTSRKLFSTIILTDIAITPNGTFFGGGDFSIYQIDTANGTRTAKTTTAPVIVEAMEALDNDRLIYAGSKGTDKIEIYTYTISTNTNKLIGTINGYWYPGDIVWYDDDLYMSAMIANQPDVQTGKLFRIAFDAGYTTLTGSTKIGDIEFIDGMVNVSKPDKDNILVGMGQLLRSQTASVDMGAKYLCHLYNGNVDFCSSMYLPGNIIGAASIRLPTQSTKPTKCAGMNSAAIISSSKNKISIQNNQIIAEENFNNATLKIYDLNGKIVFTQSNIHTNSIDFSLNNYSTESLYLLKIEEDGVEVFKSKIFFIVSKVLNF